MSYSNSTFTVEIDGTPTIVFQAKWHSEADEICRGWAQYHWEQLPKKELRGYELPPFVKVRLAHADERSRYGAEDARSEFYEEVKIVYLIELDALHQEDGSDDRPG